MHKGRRPLGESGQGCAGAMKETAVKPASVWTLALALALARLGTAQGVRM